MDGMVRARWLIAEERERQTGFLDLGNLGLTELPAELFELSHLKSLAVGFSGFEPAAGCRASGNRGPRNAIESLPAILGRLHALESLMMDGNPVSDLAPLRDLTSLKSLSCSDTRVSDWRRSGASRACSP